MSFQQPVRIKSSVNLMLLMKSKKYATSSVIYYRGLPGTYHVELKTTSDVASCNFKLVVYIQGEYIAEICCQDKQTAVTLFSHGSATRSVALMLFLFYQPTENPAATPTPLPESHAVFRLTVVFCVIFAFTPAAIAPWPR